LGSDLPGVFEVPTLEFGYVRLAQIAPVLLVEPQSEAELTTTITEVGSQTAAWIFLAHGWSGRIRAWNSSVISDLNPGIFKFLDPKAPVLFLSCEAGQGIARRLASQISNTVIAPMGSVHEWNDVIQHPVYGWSIKNVAGGITAFQGLTQTPLPPTPPITFEEFMDPRWLTFLQQRHAEGSWQACFFLVRQHFWSEQVPEATHYLLEMKNSRHGMGKLKLLSWLRGHHKNDQPFATFALGMFYGDIPPKASKYFLQARDLGFFEAQQALQRLWPAGDAIAEAYYTVGQEKERKAKPERAVFYYDQAAQRGHSRAKTAWHRLRDSHPEYQGIKAF
jgi:hypothetical protein